MSGGFESMIDPGYVRKVPAISSECVRGSVALSLLGYKEGTKRKQITNQPSTTTSTPKKQLVRIMTTEGHSTPNNCILIISNLITVKRSKTPASRDDPNVFIVDLTAVPVEQLTEYENLKTIYENLQKQLYINTVSISEETQNRFFKDVLLVPIRAQGNVNIYDKFKHLSYQLMVDYGNTWRYPYANNPMNPSALHDIGGSGNVREVQVGDVYEFE